MQFFLIAVPAPPLQTVRINRKPVSICEKITVI